MKKILIGSCGGLTGYYLIKNFKKFPDYEVYGADAGSPMAAGNLLDCFYKLPSASAGVEFVDKLIEILNREHIDYYFPTHSRETSLISQYENYIRERTGTGFVISPYETFEKLDDKAFGNAALETIGIPAPKQYSDNDMEYTFPVFVKHRLGSGSHDARRIDSVEQLQAYRNLYDDIAVFDYIKGDEYTVDALFDSYGKLVAYNQRIRLKQMGGATICTVNDYTVDVEEHIRKLASIYICKGVVNFQFILKDGIPYFTDINLRYASGGLPLSVHSGMDIFELLPRIIDGEHAENMNCNISREKCTMYRHFEESYE